MKTIITLLFTALILNVFSQEVGKIYKVDSEFQGNLFYFTTCQKDSVDVICKNATFEVVSVSATEDIVTIKIKSGLICDDYAEDGSTYCVRKAVFATPPSVHVMDKKWTASLGGGILTVPFKFDRKSFKVFPSGEIGAVGGLKLNYNKTGGNIILAGILGLSSIPLNDLNSSLANEIKTVSGVTVGGGLSINVAKGFQFGIYYGVDFYNTDNTKYQKDWLSFGLGYDFFRFLDEAKIKKANPILAPLQ